MIWAKGSAALMLIVASQTGVELEAREVLTGLRAEVEAMTRRESIAFLSDLAEAASPGDATEARGLADQAWRLVDELAPDSDTDLDFVLSSLGLVDPVLALRRAQAVGRPTLRNFSLAAVARSSAPKDPVRAADAINGIDERPMRIEAGAEALQALIRENPAGIEAFIDRADALPREDAIELAIADEARLHGDRCVALLRWAELPSSRDRASLDLIELWREGSQDQLEEIASGMADPALRALARAEIGRRFASREVGLRALGDAQSVPNLELGVRAELLRRLEFLGVQLLVPLINEAREREGVLLAAAWSYVDIPEAVRYFQVAFGQLKVERLERTSEGLKYNDAYVIYLENVAKNDPALAEKLLFDGLVAAGASPLTDLAGETAYWDASAAMLRGLFERDPKAAEALAGRLRVGHPLLPEIRAEAYVRDDPKSATEWLAEAPERMFDLAEEAAMRLAVSDPEAAMALVRTLPAADAILILESLKRERGVEPYPGWEDTWRAALVEARAYEDPWERRAALIDCVRTGLALSAPPTR